MAKEGSTVSGLMDTFATTISVALQYGVPLRDLVNKFAHVRFEPSGFTGNQEIPIAKSIVDYIFRWLGSRFLSVEDQQNAGAAAAGRGGGRPAVGWSRSAGDNRLRRPVPCSRRRHAAVGARVSRQPESRRPPSPMLRRRRPSPPSRRQTQPDELKVIATNGARQRSRRERQRQGARTGTAAVVPRPSP